MATWKGRGLDFEHRFRTSRWAEDLLQEAITKSGKLLCFKLGLSQIAADNRPEAGSTQYKVPDLILFSPDKLTPSDRQWLDQHDLTQISPETMLADDSIRSLFSKACCAIEVEFSPYRAAEMKQRHWKRKLLSDLDRRPLKHANPPTAPNIWVKLEDLPRIQAWEGTFGIPVVIAHLFDQEAFAIPLITLSDFEADWPDQSNEAIRRQLTTGIFRKTQSYDRVDAPGSRRNQGGLCRNS